MADSNKNDLRLEREKSPRSRSKNALHYYYWSGLLLCMCVYEMKYTPYICMHVIYYSLRLEKNIIMRNVLIVNSISIYVSK
jgi:hypothetical protein